MVAGAVAFSVLQSPLYQGDVKVLLQPPSSNSLLPASSGDQSDPSRMVSNQADVIKSAPVQAAVRHKLGPVAKVAVSADPGTSDVVDIEGQGADPARARAVTKAYANAYIDLRRAQSLDSLRSATRGLQGQIDSLQHQITDLDARSVQAAASGPGGVDQAASLSAERDALLSQEAPLQQRLSALQVDANLANGDVQLISTGSVPTSKVRPHPLESAGVAVVLGIIIGIGVAALREYLDDSIKDKDDLERAAPGLTVLGLMPRVREWRNPGRSLMVSMEHPASPAAEAFRTLRVTLQFVGLPGAGQPAAADQPLIWQVTSSKAADGKTSVVVNLAVAMARAGQHVAVVDCDLRRARVHKFFDLSNQVGFTSVYLGQVSSADALQTVPGEDNLAIMASGPLPPNPSEIVSSKRSAEILRDLGSGLDVVLVDCPPVLGVSDPIALSQSVDAVVVVATTGETTRKEVRRTVDLLSKAGAPIVGTILNQVTAEDTYGYDYDYSSKGAIEPVAADATPVAASVDGPLAAPPTDGPPVSPPTDGPPAAPPTDGPPVAPPTDGPPVAEPASLPRPAVPAGPPGNPEAVPALGPGPGPPRG